MAQENIVVDLIDGSLAPGDIYVSGGFLDVNNVLHLIRENEVEVVIDLQALIDNYPDKHVASGSFDDSTKQITLVFNDGSILPIAIDLSSITMDEWAGKNYEPTHTYDIGDLVTSPVDNNLYYAEATPQPGAPGTAGSGWVEVVGGGSGSVVYANRQEVFDGVLLDKVVNPDSLNQKVPSSGSDGFVLTKGTNGNTWQSVSASAIDHNSLSNIGNNTHSQIDTHISNVNNPHATKYEDLQGTQPAPVSHTHVESQITDLDKYTKQEVEDRDANVQGNLDTHIGDSTNPHAVTKAQVGLSNADNTSDADKSVSSATQTALDLKIAFADTVDTLIDTSPVNPLSANMGKKLNDLKTEWKGEWVPNTYLMNQMVRDGAYTAIANQTTAERPSPQDVGLPYNLYTGTLVPGSVVAKQILFGTRYTVDTNIQVNRYRVDVLAGNEYQVYIVKEPTTDKTITLLHTFIPTVSGWVELGIDNIIMKIGEEFDLVVQVDEPTGTPTITTHSYSYTRPNNVTVPTSGQISHSTSNKESLSVHKFNAVGGDASAFLEGLTIGDVVELETIRWAIQKVVDNGTYMTFQISPAINYGSTGTYDVNFETVTATPITTGKEVDYLFGKTNRGMFIVDGAYEDIVPDDNHYGIDVLIQEITISTHWDIVATSARTGSGNSDVTYATEKEVLDGVLYDRAVSPDTLNIKVPTIGIDGQGLIKNATGNEFKNVVQSDISETGAEVTRNQVVMTEAAYALITAETETLYFLKD